MAQLRLTLFFNRSWESAIVERFEWITGEIKPSVAKNQTLQTLSIHQRDMLQFTAESFTSLILKGLMLISYEH